MHRFFVPPALWQEESRRLHLPAPVIHHALTVLRLKPGAVLGCFDGAGREVSGTLDASDPPMLLIDSERKILPASLRLVLGQGLPKGDKLEQILQHGTELGLDVLFPLTLERALLRVEPAKVPARLQRWQRIAEEAARQSRRVSVPAVHPPCGLEAFLQAFRAHAPEGQELVVRHGLLLYEDVAVGTELATLLANLGAPHTHAQTTTEFWLLIGPEGGLAPGEVRSAQEAGFLPVSLGPRILRTETASLAVLAVLSLGEGLYRSA